MQHMLQIYTANTFTRLDPFPSKVTNHDSNKWGFCVNLWYFDTSIFCDRWVCNSQLELSSILKTLESKIEMKVKLKQEPKEQVPSEEVLR